MATSSVAYNKPVLPRVSDTSDLASNRASVFSGKALYFDGANDEVSFGALSQITTGDITFSAYFSTTNTAVQYIFQNSSLYVATNRDSSGGAGNLSVYISSGAWIDTGVFVGDGRIHHLVISIVSEAVGIYLDGQLINSGQTRTYSKSSFNAFLGQRDSGSRWAGNIAHVKWFDTGLSAAQVAELYNNPEQILPTGVSAVNLKLWLPMMEGAGSYVYNGAAGSLGPELVSNGGFDEVCQKWGITDNGYATITNGKVVWNAPNGSGANVVQYLSGIQAGKTYRVSFDYSVNRDGFGLQLGDYTGAVTSTNTGTGRFTTDIKVGNANGGYFLLNMSAGTGDLVGYMDNVSVKEVVPQATGTISGATWVSGQGEPLPQTALMDWNGYERQATEDNTDYYQGTLTIPTNNGTIVFKHITDPLLSDNKYIFGLGTSSLGYTRAIRLRSTGKYGFVSYGSGTEDFDTIVNYTAGKPTTFALSWDETKYVNIYSDGLLAESVYKSGLNNLSGSRTLRLYGSNFNADSNRGTIIYWAYYNRVLTTAEINDINTGKVEPTDVDDLEYYFTHQNGYSYNGATLTKTGGDFDRLLIPSGSTSGKDIFGNPIAVPRSSGAFNFDLQSYVKGPTLGVMPTGNGSRTLEVWVYYKPNGLAQSLLEIGSGVAGNGRFGILANPTNVGSVYIVGQANDNHFASIIIDSNQWTHLVATHDGTTLNVYKNGVLSGTAGETYNTVDTGYTIGLEQRTSTPLSISSAYEWAQSQVSNPRIYNYALTANQVADNFNQKASTFGKTKVTGELQAYINRTVAAGATVEAHSALLNTLTELENK